MTCIIVEDEPLAQLRLRDYIKRINNLQLEACFDSASDALQYLKEHSIDLIFLDIQLEGLSGVELLERHKPAAQVIFTTAFPGYAIKSYELNVTDYLLKPFGFERFHLAIEKANQKQLQGPGLKEKNFIFVKSANTIEKILIGDILYIVGMRDYRKIYTTTRSIMTLQNFIDFEKELPSELICRVHKSFMVAIARIDAIDNNKISIGNRIIPVSATYKKNLLGIISNYR